MSMAWNPSEAMTIPKRSALALFWRDQGWFSLLFIMAGVALGHFTYQDHQRNRELSSMGAEATALITQKSRSTRGTGSRTNTVSYAFPTAQDPYTRGQQTVSDEYYGGVQEGDRVPVRYLPTDTTISEVEFGTPAVHSLLGLFAGGALLLGGLGSAGYMIRKAGQGVWLREHGAVRRAEVVGHAAEGRNSKTGKTGRARWRDAAGQDGRSLIRRMSELPAVGTDIVIYADPGNKRVSVWEGDVGSR
jgi:hypothetical protein